MVGTAGTVGQGAIDPLLDLAEFCRQEGLWFHVDGAIGAALRCSKQLASLVEGIERADSVAFDFHKWFFVPYEAGCVVFRDADAHKATFESPAHYLSVLDGGITAKGEAFFNDLGPELSRGMRALKVWMSIQEAGFDKIGMVIENNLAQAAYLARRLADPRVHERRWQKTTAVPEPRRMGPEQR